MESTVQTITLPDRLVHVSPREPNDSQQKRDKKEAERPGLVRPWNRHLTKPRIEVFDHLSVDLVCVPPI